MLCLAGADKAHIENRRDKREGLEHGVTFVYKKTRTGGFLDRLGMTGKINAGLSDTGSPQNE